MKGSFAPDSKEVQDDDVMSVQSQLQPLAQNLSDKHPDIQNFQKSHRVQVCTGCGLKIADQWVLKVAPDMVWHAHCLKCYECLSSLDENCTCFVKEGRTYCKKDYAKLFGIKCSSCSAGFLTSDLVMKARSSIFHLDCFRCAACNRKLVAGDEYSINEHNAILCRDDHQLLHLNPSEHFQDYSKSPGGADNEMDVCEKLNSASEQITSESTSGRGEEEGGLQRALPAYQGHMHPGVPATTRASSSSSSSLLMYPLQAHNTNSMNPTNCNGRYRGGMTVKGHHHHHHHHHHHKDHHHHHHHHKTTRIRTVLNEKQLHTLRTCYSVNSRPDALMKEQLVEMTGLSPRVIRVWFQNKRCKDKKRSLVLKQLQQQNQNKAEKGFSDDSWFSHKAIPLIATSPILHEPSNDVQATNIEIEKCPTPFWLDMRQQESHGASCPDEIGQFSVQSNHTQYRHPLTSLTESTNQDDDTVVSFDDVNESMFTPNGEQH